MPFGLVLWGLFLWGLFLWGLFLWGEVPHPARERGPLDPVLAGRADVFQTNNCAAWGGANTGGSRSDNRRWREHGVFTK